MKAAHGRVFKYGDNVDTDVIIPARYLNSSDPKELATHRSEEHTSELQSRVDITYAVFCLKKALGAPISGRRV
mgnify:CR=1 FL=1